MNLHELFEIGVSFRTFLLNQPHEQRAKFMKYYIPISMKQELRERIDQIDKRVLILGIVDGICQNNHIHLAVLEKLISTNQNIVLKFITSKDAEGSLKDYWETGMMKTPVFIFMDEGLQEKASFIGNSADTHIDSIALQLVELIEKIG